VVQKRQKILKEPGTGEIAGTNDQFRKKLSHKEAAAADGTEELEVRFNPPSTAFMVIVLMRVDRNARDLAMESQLSRLLR
jgi:hypothetical protein